MAIGEKEGRQFVVQRSLQGGLSPNSDILKARDSGLQGHKDIVKGLVAAFGG